MSSAEFLQSVVKVNTAVADAGPRSLVVDKRVDS